MYSTLRTMVWTAREESSAAPYSLRKKLYWWRRGFMAESAALYDFPRNDPFNYLSDYVRLQRCRRINPMPALLDHKLLLRRQLLDRGFTQPETVAVLLHGAVLMFPLSPEPRWTSCAELETWLLQDGGRFVIKPETGTRGAGVRLVEVQGDRLVQQRGTHVEPFAPRASGRVSIVERLVEQHEFWRSLHPQTANSIRIVTMITRGDSVPFVGTAVQRIGTPDSVPTDNWSGGGICAPIDLGTGCLGIGRMHPRKGRDARPAYTHHPVTGAPIAGAVLPHWEAVKETVLRACASLPLVLYAGWDVLVDRSGMPVILEGNNNTDVNLLQMHGGLLEREAVRRFYESYATA